LIEGTLREEAFIFVSYAFYSTVCAGRLLFRACAYRKGERGRQTARAHARTEERERERRTRERAKARDGGRAGGWERENERERERTREKERESKRERELKDRDDSSVVDREVW